MSEDYPWYDQYPDYWPKGDVKYPKQTLPEVLRDRTETFADNTAFIFADRMYTYRELQEQVDTLANALADIGVEQGDHVSLCMPNCPQQVFAFYAVLTLGATTVHTSFLYTESELEQQLTDAEATSILVLDTYADKVSNVIDDTGLENIIVTSLSEVAPSTIRKHIGRTNKSIVNAEDWYWFADLMDAHDSEDPPRPDIDIDDLACLPYTGGTTGFPKGVMISHRNCVDEAALGELFDLVAYDEDGEVERGEQTVTGLMPMFHVNGNFTANFIPVFNGSAVVLYPEFDPGRVLRDIENHGITHMHAVPTMVTALLEHPRSDDVDFSSLRHLMVGSAPVPSDTKQRFEELTGAVVFEGYGLTEAAMGVTVEPTTNRREGSCGIPLPGVEADIVDVDTAESLPAGETGEIIARMDNPMQGYWNNEAATDETIRDGWVHTGDLGYRDEDWFYYHVDRMDDMIVTSGHNVYPSEIEDVLYDHEAVREAAVIGLPDEYRGKLVAAFVERHEDVGIDDDELTEELDAWCRDSLAAYKVPREYRFQELPRTDVGKISRSDLKDEVLGDAE